MRTSCAPCAVADLVPSIPTTGSCTLTGTPSLKVRVTNVGEAKAGEFDVRLEFPAKSARDSTQRTPATQRVKGQGAKGSVDVNFNLPRSCFSPNCVFRLTVDPANAVVEKNEGNNVVTGSCSP